MTTATSTNVGLDHVTYTETTGRMLFAPTTRKTAPPKAHLMELGGISYCGFVDDDSPRLLSHTHRLNIEPDECVRCTQVAADRERR